MCGIAGIVGDIHNGSEILQTMLRVQKHRGPDGSHIWADREILLGHNRLSIIDLSDNANQPMQSNSGRYVMVFNGEIYNYLELKNELPKYVFKSDSDSEVLLAAYIEWGESCLHRLNGMFSFAIWDQQTKMLFAARDRFGVKPFYYSMPNGTFYFASEIKTLHAAGIEASPLESVWASYFAYGSYGAPDETFWQDIQQLPAGHCLTLASGAINVSRWYCFADEVNKLPLELDEKSAMSRYMNILKDSIKLRFRSDVPVGINISGGLDSSILLALVNRYQFSEKTNAYTFYTGHSDYDEIDWVEKMISTAGNPLSKVLLSAEQVPALSKLYAANQDEPYGGIPTIAYGQLFEKARKDGILVLLDGQGLDEQWAGYDYYRQQNNAIIQGVSGLPFYPNVLSKDFRGKAVVPEYPQPFPDDLRNKQYRDLFYTKLPRALRFSDRISMMYSTELREPFLDHRLVELAFSLPEHYKINGDISKYILREIAAQYLPETIRNSGKRALQTPQREWLSNEMVNWTSSLILGVAEEMPQWFNKEELLKEWQRFIDGDRNSSFHIWQYINTNLLVG